MSCEIIAELSWCHVGDMDIADRMIFAAKENGADYVKFQTWHVKNLKKGPWDSDGRIDIYKKAELTEDNYLFLLKKCKEYQIKFLTSCFCEDDIDFIRTISNEVKIPGTECSNISLVENVIKKFDRVFISTGASKKEEYIRWCHYNNVYLMHCVSSYPCQINCVNIPKLIYLSKLTPRFGYSGHLQGIDDAIAAISLGSKIIEKHFTIDNDLPGRDNKFAILPHDLLKIRNYLNNYNLMSIDYGQDYQLCEIDSRENNSRRWCYKNFRTDSVN